jgi:hypothetical protein
MSTFRSDYKIHINIVYGQNAKYLRFEPGSSLHIVPTWMYTVKSY